MKFLSLALAAGALQGALASRGRAIVGKNVPTAATEAFPLPENLVDWEFQYVEGSQCMDGRETGVWLRKGADPDKLVIFFQGGGACFNIATCLIASTDPRGMSPNPGNGGIFDTENELNAMKDYNVAWVPYCSGDVFLGTKESSVPLVGKKKFMGRTNLDLLLQRLQPTFPEVTDIVLTGESAGGFGALANFDFVVQAWEQADGNKLINPTLIDDCGPVMADPYMTPCLQTIWRDLYDVDSSLPADCADCTQEDGGGLVNYYDFMQDKYKNAKFGLIESTRDTVISLFFSFGANDCNVLIPPAYGATFEAGLKDVFENRLKENFASMIFPGTKHTYTSTNAFYKEEHMGVLLSTWYSSLLDGKILKINPWDDVDYNNTMAYLNDEDYKVALNKLGYE